MAILRDGRGKQRNLPPIKTTTSGSRQAQRVPSFVTRHASSMLDNKRPTGTVAPTFCSTGAESEWSKHASVICRHLESIQYRKQKSINSETASRSSSYNQESERSTALTIRCQNLRISTTSRHEREPTHRRDIIETHPC